MYGRKSACQSEELHTYDANWRGRGACSSSFNAETPGNGFFKPRVSTIVAGTSLIALGASEIRSGPVLCGCFTTSSASELPDISDNGPPKMSRSPGNPSGGSATP